MTTLNIAHRGGAALMPENTLAAFANAIALGADGAELDVQLSADGVAVVHHDFRLNPGYARDGAGRWLKGETPRIKDLRLAELQRFDLGRPAPGSDYAYAHPMVAPVDGARIPSLAEVLAFAAAAPSPFLLLVELKSDAGPDSADPVALADAALAACASHLGQVIFVGFDWRGLLRVRQAAPMARCWFTTDKLEGDYLPMLDAIKAAGGDGWFPHHRDATGLSISDAHARGLKIGAWTVNETAEMSKLARQGIDLICTDWPDLLSKALEQRRRKIPFRK
jgi:glycerophosphoryl diester phosphodiesterase